MFRRNLLSKIPKFHFASKIDYLGISHFTPELKELRTMVRKFCDDVVSPLAVKTDKNDKFPNHLWKEMGNLGLLGITCPSKLIILGNFFIDDIYSGIWRKWLELYGSLHGHGRSEQGEWVYRTFLWGSYRFVSGTDRETWERGTKEKISTKGKAFIFINSINCLCGI